MAALRTTSSSMFAHLAAATAALALLAPAPTSAQQLPGNFLITGTVLCTIDSTTIITAAAAPVFPYASVQLQCGKRVISSTTSNVNGAFALLMTGSIPVTSLLNECKLVIPTPLSACNASLPTTGTLQSPLQLLSGGLLGGLIGVVVTLIPTMFSFVNV